MIHATIGQAPVPSTTAPAVRGQAGAPAPAATGQSGTATAPPKNFADMAALRARRGELSNQYRFAVSVRDQLSRQLRSAASGADRAGIEQRISQLDKRIIQLDADIAETGRQIANAPGYLNVGAEQPPIDRTALDSDQITGISIVFILAVLAPMAVAFARIVWRRGAHPARSLPSAPEVTPRLDRMEQGIEAIAIEVERISEGQRFVTQLLNQRALPEGQPPAAPIRIPAAEAVRRGS